jgi:integrase
MKIFLRSRQQTKKGKTSLYLELYKGTKTTEDGKIVPDREYEYLDLFLIPKPKNPIDRQHNKEQLALANSIRAKRELEIKEGKHGFTPSFKSKANFIEYFEFQANRKNGERQNWLSALKVLKEYAGENVPFNSIDKKFCEGFKNFLNEKHNKLKKPFSMNTKRGYFKKFRTALNASVKEEIIQRSPADGIPGFGMPDSKREYLTIDQVRVLYSTHCENDLLKRAFLFSCLTGIRFSDIKVLKWGNLENNNGNWRVNFRQRKTMGMEYLDINSEAYGLCGERSDQSNIFYGVKNDSRWNQALREWCASAGITKHITFHSGRHTHAVMQLTVGTDLYTVSKLLGHRDVRTTQIYAKIVDEKKREAVNKIPLFKVA